MQVHEIIGELNSQIAKLKEARALLAGAERAGKRGRPPGAARKRRLTPEGRKRISEALKRRWAAHRKAQAKTVKK